MGAASTALGSLADELTLDGGGTTFRREIRAAWTWGDDRVFGGYGAALALGAAAEAVGAGRFVSCHVMFADATRPGPAEIGVEVVRRGRSLVAVRSTLRSAGGVSVVAQAWLDARPLDAWPLDARPKTAPPEPDGAGPRPVLEPAPQDCPPLVFRAAALPFMGVFEERVVAYPESAEELYGSRVGGPSAVDVWARPRGGEELTPLGEQLFDLMVLDAHVLDGALWSRPRRGVQTSSLDLAVQWHGTVPVRGWRRVRTQAGPLTGPVVSTTGTVLSQHGAPVATAVQQGKVIRSR